MFISSELKAKSKPKPMEKYFSKKRDDWILYYSGRDIYAEIERKTKRHMPFFNCLDRLISNGFVAEIGAGYGVCMAVMNKLFKISPFGLDVSNKMVRFAKSNFIHIVPNLSRHLICGSAINLPFDNNFFEVIYSQGLLEHFNDKEINSITLEGLRVAKYFIFSVPTCYFKSNTHLIGNERLLPKSVWEDILNSFRFLESSYYCDNEEYYAVVTEKK